MHDSKPFQIAALRCEISLISWRIAIMKGGSMSASILGKKRIAAAELKLSKRSAALANLVGSST